MNAVQLYTLDYVYENLKEVMGKVTALESKCARLEAQVNTLYNEFDYLNKPESPEKKEMAKKQREATPAYHEKKETKELVECTRPEGCMCNVWGKGYPICKFFIAPSPAPKTMNDCWDEGYAPVKEKTLEDKIYEVFRKDRKPLRANVHWLSHIAKEHYRALFTKGLDKAKTIKAHPSHLPDILRDALFGEDYET